MVPTADTHPTQRAAEGRPLAPGGGCEVVILLQHAWDDNHILFLAGARDIAQGQQGAINPDVDGALRDHQPAASLARPGSGGVGGSPEGALGGGECVTWPWDIHWGGQVLPDVYGTPGAQGSSLLTPFLPLHRCLPLSSHSPF